MSKHLHPISAVMLAHQYSSLLEKVVQSVQWCDEIIIVTSEKVKEIEELCHRTKAQLFFQKFEGFGTQKRFAISKANHDWVLSIDSDEIVSPELEKKVQSLINSEAVEDFSAFRIQRKLVFLGKPMSFSGTSDKPLRLFNRKKAQMTNSAVHEQVITDSKTGYIKDPIYHFSYSSLEDYFTKFNRYTSLAAQDLYQRGKKTNFFLIWGRWPLLFFRRYIFQLGFLDGQYGFVWSFLSAWYSSIKYLKLRELNLSRRNVL
jgi:GTP:adenosylcobinamide-phosphate guanylyltransferase